MKSKKAFGLVVLSVVLSGACNAIVENSGEVVPCVPPPGTGGGGGAGGAPGCPANLLECNGVCVDPAIDPAHCGGCDIKCEEGRMCSQGMCVGVAVCVPGETRVCYSGELATLGVGTCKAGIETCNAAGTGWGECAGEVVPNLADNCKTLSDENCNGIMNDGCTYASCRDIRDTIVGVPSGIYQIDADGLGGVEPFDAYCDMEHDGGGWTLVMVSSDDGQDTWTWNKRALMTTNKALVGSVHEPHKDFKSPALHLVLFKDLMFLHAPSFKWAAYAGVGNGESDIGTFMGGIPAPVCNLSLAGNSHAITAGTIEQAGKLCDTDLYFHLGDFDGFGDPIYCATEGDATYGPSWNIGDNNGCPFDDPAVASFGPDRATGWQDKEVSNAGFGYALDLNKGMPGAAQNYIQMYVR